MVETEIVWFVMALTIWLVTGKTVTLVRAVTCRVSRRAFRQMMVFSNTPLEMTLPDIWSIFTASNAS